MENIGTVITGLVALLGAVGSGYAWIKNRQDKAKDPIPKDSAAVALSASAVAVSQSVINDVVARMNEMSGRNKILENRITAAEGTIEHHERLFGAALSYIESLLRHIRDGKPWPPTPAPGELRDMIDPDLH